MGIRVVVLDDNPHVSWQGRVHPVNATFHRFLSAVLDVPGAPVSEIVHAVPLRAATEAPRTLALDERLTVVGTEPFEGIPGFLRRAPTISRRNAPILRAALADADLLWLKVPASNALLAAWLARRAGVPRFGYVAGSAREVAAGRWSGPRSIGAQVVGLAWDAAGLMATARAPRAVVGREIFTSLVEPGEIRDPHNRPWPWETGHLRLAWAGRLVRGKGLERVLGVLPERPLDRLIVLGDGPEAGSLRELAVQLGVAERVEWRGYVADRASYMEVLASADVFVFPSPAEGFPKVVLDAWAAGLPVIASPAGGLARLRKRGLFLDPAQSIAAALTAETTVWSALRRTGSAFAAAHTRPREARRLVDLWRRSLPNLGLSGG